MLGVHGGFAGDRWDMVVKGFFSEVVESVRHAQMVRTNRAANSLALRPNLAAR
jgi:hypothetical protein